MDKTTVDLSIIIVNWNVSALLEKCLDSVFANLPARSVEVIVFDNASVDNSVEMIRSRFPMVRLVEHPENLGFGRGNNEAYKHCSGRFILLLNPDTIVYPNALDRMVDYIEANPLVGAVGSNLLNPDGSLQPSCFPFPTIAREMWRLFHLDALYPYALYPLTRWDKNTPREVDALQGTCLLLRREVIEQVGLFDPEFFLYSEEIDLCYRLKRAGWKLFWVPAADVVHFGGQSARQAATKSFLHLYKGKLLFFRKHYGVSAASAYRFVLIAATLARIAITPLAWLEPAPRRERHLKLAQNYIALLKHIPSL